MRSDILKLIQNYEKENKNSDGFDIKYPRVLTGEWLSEQTIGISLGICESFANNFNELMDNNLEGTRYLHKASDTYNIPFDKLSHNCNLLESEIEIRRVLTNEKLKRDYMTYLGWELLALYLFENEYEILSIKTKTKYDNIMSYYDETMKDIDRNKLNLIKKLSK